MNNYYPTIGLICGDKSTKFLVHYANTDRFTLLIKSLIKCLLNLNEDATEGSAEVSIETCNCNTLQSVIGCLKYSPIYVK